IWKYERNLADWRAASGANVDGSAKIPLGTTQNSLTMPVEITAPAGGPCPAEPLITPYPATTRLNNGFCDYETHYMLDINNTDPENLFYTHYLMSDPRRSDKFNYSSLVTSVGINLTDNPTTPGGGGTLPISGAYFMLGVKATDAVSTSYAGIIVVDYASF